MESLKVSEQVALQGKGPMPVRPVAQEAAFQDALKTARNMLASAEKTAAADNFQTDPAQMGTLAAPVAITITPLPLAALGYESARAAFGAARN